MDLDPTLRGGLEWELKICPVKTSNLNIKMAADDIRTAYNESTAPNIDQIILMCCCDATCASFSIAVQNKRTVCKRTVMRHVAASDFGLARDHC